MAIAAHPDDIEFMMAGTLLLLKEAGWEIHYMNLANGSCGTAEHSKEDIVRIRTTEAQDATDILGATFHSPLVGDLEVFYTPELVCRVCAVIRQVDPQILLVPSPQDYMEDHANTSRLAVSAAFNRGMKNYESSPSVPPVSSSCAVYHALPYGLRDGLRQRISAGLYTDITSVIDRKEEALAAHRSQKEWLDTSQGLDAYLVTMREMSAEVGTMSGAFSSAEGWRRHLHLGLSPEGFDPLCDVLKDKVVINQTYEDRLNSY